MFKNKFLKFSIFLVIAGIIIGGGVALYLFNMPHRDVQASKADFKLTTSQIVNEYLADKDAANKKYLAADGESKILVVTGTVQKISTNMNGQQVVLLKEKTDKAGVSATFAIETSAKAETLNVGEKVSVKGVIRSGASYDEDLEMYENVILEKSDLIKQ